MNFAEVIIKLLIEYKALLKKYLSEHERIDKLSALGLAHRFSVYDDLVLYHKAKQVAEDIRNWLEVNPQTASWYSGLDEFFHHLSNTLANHRIEKSKVIHITQMASSALVEAIQIIQFSRSSLNETSNHKLSKCYSIIAQYGTDEQQKIFMNALKKCLPTDGPVIVPTLKTSTQHLVA